MTDKQQAREAWEERAATPEVVAGLRQLRAAWRLERDPTTATGEYRTEVAAFLARVRAVRRPRQQPAPIKRRAFNVEPPPIYVLAAWREAIAEHCGELSDSGDGGAWK